MTKREDTSAKGLPEKPVKPPRDAARAEPSANNPTSIAEKPESLTVDPDFVANTFTRVRLDEDQVHELNHVETTLNEKQIKLLMQHVSQVKLDEEQLKTLLCAEVKLNEDQVEKLRNTQVKFNEAQLAALLRALAPSPLIASESIRKLIDAFNAMKR